jgi:hypothetical protein
MILSDVFRCLPVFGHFLVQRIHLSDFYVKHKFPFGGINVRDVLKLFKYLLELLWGQVWILFPTGNRELL